MVLQRRLTLSVVIMLLFVQLGFCLNSRTEWLSFLELRSSLGIRGKDWPLKAEPCRNWTGVQCRNGRVIGINISGLKRTRIGRVHPSFDVDALTNLTALASFNASGFMLNGSIPDWFGQNLSAMEVLDLRSCSITGLIPESLKGLSVLKTLLLSGNSLTGRMPSSLGLLSELSVLDLSGNSLSGSVPNALSKLGNLTKLDLSSNFLSGSIPPELGSLSNLHILNLSDNELTASVPVQLGNLSKLVELDLGMNSLSGSLPDSLFSSWSLPSLHVLDVSSNNLTGPLPKFSNVSSAGAIFNLSNNLFYGSLNTSFTKFKMIDLSGNYLEVVVQGGGNVTLTKNCLQMIPDQRDSEDCRLFYAQRSLPFAPGIQEPTQSPFQESRSRNNKRVTFILAGTFGGLGFIVLVALVLILVLRHCTNHSTLAIERGTANGGAVPEGESPTPPKDPVFVTSVGKSFTFEQILHLTGNFAEANIMKHGHSGDLYWGVSEGGAIVVIKKVDLNLFKRESYIVELGLLSKVSHARLVPILGHCLENENEKYIIYKYMPNGDLVTSLHRVTGSDGKLQSLDWITRSKIAIGAAEGLAYLHECSPPIVHRDIQASSILLDDKFEVRLGSLSEVTCQGDFHQSAFSRLFSKPLSFNQGNPGTSSVSSDYDVYCFGKILLELVTGNLDISNSDDAMTKEWLEQTLSYITIYDKERVTKILDPSLIIDEDLLEEVWAMAIVARSCLNPKPSKRPLMRHVLKALENPLKVVREDNGSSERLRTTSSRRYWSSALFGSWRHSSSENATATGNAKEGTSSFKQSCRVGSQRSVGFDHSSSNKRSSNEIFPEPFEMQEVEIGEGR
ncbi:PREDICTED: probable LRR receptor-like serine/threonine-protein kinase At2g16250 isoform X2 [Lupinus angustifolius]|uniref:probable LRR receptor-like serine/threonine-protein kinase At2g16250 isoform X2 n=1 Tax=Lupinus angustifolius TaxID=3871 RepID=UPI00092ED5C6|nr:PREDICTED: probable LRR receptor-like serine/threonine-protein kinase At2g16250 isoform X2 [Lupinus angustifolius]